MSDWPKVLPNDHGIRPAGLPDQCFYCGRPVGEPHAHDCVTIEKRVEYDVISIISKPAVVGRYQRNEPYLWTPEECEYHTNHSTWCKDNAMEGGIVWNDSVDARACQSVWLREPADRGCMCDKLDFKFLRVVDAGPLVTLREEKEESLPPGPTVTSLMALWVEERGTPSQDDWGHFLEWAAPKLVKRVNELETKKLYALGEAVSGLGTVRASDPSIQCFSLDDDLTRIPLEAFKTCGVDPHLYGLFQEHDVVRTCRYAWKPGGGVEAGRIGTIVSVLKGRDYAVEFENGEVIDLNSTYLELYKKE